MRRKNEEAMRARQERIAIANAKQEELDKRYIEEGLDVMQLIWSCPCEICEKYQMRLFSLTGRTPGLPTKQELVDAGVFHPDCIHSYAAISDFERETSFDERGYPLPKDVVQERMEKRDAENDAWLNDFAKKHNI